MVVTKAWSDRSGSPPYVMCNNGANLVKTVRFTLSSIFRCNLSNFCRVITTAPFYVGATPRTHPARLGLSGPIIGNFFSFHISQFTIYNSQEDLLGIFKDAFNSQICIFNSHVDFLVQADLIIMQYIFYFHPSWTKPFHIWIIWFTILLLFQCTSIHFQLRSCSSDWIKAVYLHFQFLKNLK